jgi:predicted nucleic acid-binding Zn ribbon protein
MGTAKKAPKKKSTDSRQQVKKYRLCVVCNELFFSVKVDNLTCSRECLKRGRLYKEARERVEGKRDSGELDVRFENTPSTSIMLSAISHLIPAEEEKK